MYDFRKIYSGRLRESAVFLRKDALHGDRFARGEFLERQENADRTQTEEIMYRKYFSALQKLPRRKSILAVGGVTKYHRDLVERVLNRLGLDYFVDEKSGAIEGLKILAGEAEKR